MSVFAGIRPANTWRKKMTQYSRPREDMRMIVERAKRLGKREYCIVPLIRSEERGKRDRGNGGSTFSIQPNHPNTDS